MLKLLDKIRIRYYLGKSILKDTYFIDGKEKSLKELNKKPLRFEIINLLLKSLKKTDMNYLEIGVRNPSDNFNKIISNNKYSVDPGIEFKNNPVDFKLTSDEFFEKLNEGEILNKNLKFDVIFIDGLHLAEQVEKDIENSLKFINENGFIVLHDCNPPTEFHTRESYYFFNSPATYYWNGSTWKAFFKYRQNKELFSCCIDTDWGVGVISKKVNLGNNTLIKNPFFEYKVLNENRKESLNLLSFTEFLDKLELN